MTLNDEINRRQKYFNDVVEIFVSKNSQYYIKTEIKTTKLSWKIQFSRIFFCFTC